MIRLTEIFVSALILLQTSFANPLCLVVLQEAKKLIAPLMDVQNSTQTY